MKMKLGKGNYLRQTKGVISWEFCLSKTLRDLDGIFCVALLKSAIGKCVCVMSGFVKFMILA